MSDASGDPGPAPLEPIGMHRRDPADVALADAGAEVLRALSATDLSSRRRHIANAQRLLIEAYGTDATDLD